MSLVATHEAANLIPSPTVAIHGLANELQKKGQKIYNFGVGEMYPEILPPESLKIGRINALRANHTHYTNPQGVDELREAIRDDLKRNFDIEYDISEIFVGPGPKDVIFKVCLALLSATSKRNRVIAFAPVFEAFENIPYLLTGKPTIVLNTDNAHFPDLEALSRLLKESSDEIAIIILNSPNNPSGVVYPPHLLRKLADIIGEYPHIGITSFFIVIEAIISDEVYRTINYTGEKHVSIGQKDYLPNQTFVIGGASKEVAGTGLRLGWGCGPRQIVESIVNIQGNVTSSTDYPMQSGFAHFLQSDKEMNQRKDIVAQLKVRRDIVIRQFSSLEGLKDCRWEPPQGAFYFFPNVEKYFGRKTPNGQLIASDEDLAVYLLTQGGVATIPGSKFGKPGYLRLAFASSSPQQLEEGCKALSDTLMSLSL